MLERDRTSRYNDDGTFGRGVLVSTTGDAMKLTLQQIDKSGVIKVAAEGEITVRDFADAGKNPLEAILGTNWATNNVMLSMDKIAFIDSSAIGWLIDCQRKFKEKGGKLVLHSPTPRVRDVIELLKMRQVLNIQDTETDARASLNGEAAK